MSASQLRLASYILKEHYGDIVEEVALYILRKGWTTLACIKQDIKLNIRKIKKALCVLIQHDLIKFQTNAKKQVYYTASLPNILAILQYPRFTYCAKVLFGDASELIVEELLHHGSMSMTRIVRNVTQRLLDPALSQSDQFDQHYVADQFAELVEGHFIKRLSTSNQSVPVEDTVYVTQVEKSEYCLPSAYSYQGSGKRKISENTDDGPATKRRKSSNELMAINFQDEDILWHVNFSQFHHHLVNEMIENAVRNRVDEFAADLVKILLKLTIQSRDGYAAQTKPVSVYDIAEKLPSSSKIGRSQITQYLSLLEEDQACFVSKTGDNCGGMYAVNIRKSVEAIFVHSIESVVQERCGSKSLRIFKLLLLKKHLEQKQVEELIMVPSKEAKELLYNLLSENFITLQEVPRAADYAPSRTFYLFSVNITQICRMLLDRSYKTLGNLISRRRHETELHKRLVEKSEKIDATVLALKNQGMDENSPAVQELEEMMTDQEKQQLAKLKTLQSKLEQSELQVGNSVLVFTQYLALST